MKRIILCLAFALSACASAPRETTSTPTVAPSGNAAAIERLLRTAGERDAALITAVEHALGPADVKRQDGAGAALTYRYETCALLLVFAAGAQNQFRLAEAHPGPRRTGAPRPSLDQCAIEAGARAR